MTSTRERKDRTRPRRLISRARLDKLVEERVRLTPRDQIIAICRRRGIRQAIPLSDLPLPSPAPARSEWIDAYRHWLDTR
jgi:hypothetical protein